MSVCVISAEESNEKWMKIHSLSNVLRYTGIIHSLSNELWYTTYYNNILLNTITYTGE